MRDPRLLFVMDTPGRRITRFPGEKEVPSADSFLPENCLRESPPPLPEVGELSMVRHFTALSRRNKGVNNLFYPLGSCTMKYNPCVNEAVAGSPDFGNIHPYQSPETTQGILELLYQTEKYLAEIAGMDATEVRGHDRITLFFESDQNTANASGDPDLDSAAPARHLVEWDSQRRNIGGTLSGRYRAGSCCRIGH